MTKFSAPIYPLIARTDHTAGNVTVGLGIRRDGTIESSGATSGPPLLHDAALQSAHKLNFEYRNCSERITPYTIVCTFQLIPGQCSTMADGRVTIAHEQETRGGVTQSENRVTVVEAYPCAEGIVYGQKVRAAKCLYLWKHGYR